MAARPDLIAIIEAAYRLDLDEPAWIAGIAELAAPLLDDGNGVAAYLLDTTGRGPATHSPAFVGADPWQGQWRERWWDARVARMPVKLIADLAGFGSATYASQSCGAVMQGAVVERLARTVPPMPLPPGVSEALVVSGFDASGFGAVLFAFRARASNEPRRRPALQRIASHLATAVRLRQRRTQGRPVTAPDVERARLAKYRGRPDALELWPATREGAAIVPTSRGYVAIESLPNGAPLEPLTPRERTVASLLSLGRSNKAIAYELGIGPSTVSTLISSAAKKLKVDGAAGLIGRAHACVQTYPRAAELAPNHDLTEAETTVLCLLFAGLPDLEIATLRGCARGTITKQIDAVFKKLGVGSRRELLSSFAPWPVRARGAKLRP